MVAYFVLSRKISRASFGTFATQSPQKGTSLGNQLLSGKVHLRGAADIVLALLFAA
jgi:hypothetical protein